MRVIALTFGVLCNLCFGQAADPQLRFEVAAIKPSVPGSRGGGMRGGPGTADPERMAWTNLSLQLIVTAAYGIRGDQLSAPGWLSSEQYDISAKVPPGTTHEQFQQMLQNLLAERFHMEAHHAPKDFPAYNLVVGKNKPKLTPSSAETIAAHAVTETAPGQMASPDQTRIVGTGRNGQTKITATAATLSNLATSLAIWVG